MGKHDMICLGAAGYIAWFSMDSHDILYSASLSSDLVEPSSHSYKDWTHTVHAWEGREESLLTSPDLTFWHKKAMKTKHNHHHLRNALYSKGVRHVSFSCSKRKRRSRRLTLLRRGRIGSCMNINIKSRNKCLKLHLTNLFS